MTAAFGWCLDNRHEQCRGVTSPPDNGLTCSCACHDGAEAATYGLCTACGALEVELNEATGTRDFSGIGEAADYPTGYGCELCA